MTAYERVVCSDRLHAPNLGPARATWWCAVGGRAVPRSQAPVVGAAADAKTRTPVICMGSSIFRAVFTLVVAESANESCDRFATFELRSVPPSFGPLQVPIALCLQGCKALREGKAGSAQISFHRP